MWNLKCTVYKPIENNSILEKETFMDSLREQIENKQWVGNRKKSRCK